MRDGFLAVLIVEIGDDNPAALARHPFAGRTANPRPAAGHDADFSVESIHEMETKARIALRASQKISAVIDVLG
jgi:hypothetical protein